MSSTGERNELLTLFLCGDVMLGRGIDQILPHPGDPTLYEAMVRSALVYVDLAERANGPIPRGVEFPYVWGDALEELDGVAPDLRIINLETAITKAGSPWKGKQVHYRMHPENAACLTAAQIDCAVVANNHVMDWGYAGLAETLDTLAGLGVTAVGAGQNLQEAEQPGIFDVAGKGRVLVFAFGSESAGVPASWAASEAKPGIALASEAASESVAHVKQLIAEFRRPGDVVVVSLHWGPNWGYEIPRAARDFAHRLIDVAGVDVVHGHSSHHVKGVEVYSGQPVLYGCGDFLTDYEGIRGYEAFRDDLGLMFFVRFEPKAAKLVTLEMAPTQIRRFQVTRARPDDVRFCAAVMDRECRRLGSRVVTQHNGRLRLVWD